MPSLEQTLTILFATETGNSAALAEFAGVVAKRLGLPARVLDAATYNTTQLPLEENLLIITSTHEGEPPCNASDFFDLVDEMPDNLDSLRYAVLALGDTAYDDFCAAGQRIDRSLEARGASRLTPICDTDVGDRALAREWISQALCLFKGTPPPDKHGREAAPAPAPSNRTSDDGGPEFERRDRRSP